MVIAKGILNILETVISSQGGTIEESWNKGIWTQRKELYSMYYRYFPIVRTIIKLFTWDVHQCIQYLHYYGLMNAQCHDFYIFISLKTNYIYWNAWHKISYLFFLKQFKLVTFYLQVCISRDRWRIIRKCIAACLRVFFKRWVTRWRWWWMIRGKKERNS